MEIDSEKCHARKNYSKSRFIRSLFIRHWFVFSLDYLSDYMIFLSLPKELLFPHDPVYVRSLDPSVSVFSL